MKSSKLFNIFEFDQIEKLKLMKILFTSIALLFPLLSVSQNIEDDHGELDDIFTIVDEVASFPGGWEKWYQFLGENIRYPGEARKKGIEGRVFLTFVVDKEGDLRNIEVQDVGKGVGGGCEEEAIRILEISPKWNPGKIKGQNVNSRISLAINFRLK